MRAALSPSAAVFVHDLARVRMAPGALERLPGLAPAQARAALAVLDGGDTVAMARRLGVSIDTFKSRLADVQAKTMAARQTDLPMLRPALGRP